MKRNKFIVVLLLTVVLSIFLTKIIFYDFYIIDIKQIDMHATIVEPTRVVGMDVSSDALRFSSVPAGRQVTRYLNVSSDSPAKIIMRATGGLGQWIYSQKNITIEAGETKELNITLIAPEDAELGEYTGKLIIFFMHP